MIDDGDHATPWRQFNLGDNLCTTNCVRQSRCFELREVRARNNDFHHSCGFLVPIKFVGFLLKCAEGRSDAAFFCTIYPPKKFCTALVIDAPI